MTTAPQEANASCQQVARDHLATWLHRTRNFGRPGRRLPQSAHIDPSVRQPIAMEFRAAAHSARDCALIRVGSHLPRQWPAWPGSGGGAPAGAKSYRPAVDGMKARW